MAEEDVQSIQSCAAHITVIIASKESVFVLV
jgi:hypothetical protein